MAHLGAPFRPKIPPENVHVGRLFAFFSWNEAHTITHKMITELIRKQFRFGNSFTE